ncbi:MAG: polyamine ABC transporter ATP-binding protein, partial [Mesorhizobium sp.]
AGLAVEFIDTAFFGERRRVIARTAAGQEIDVRPTSDMAQAHEGIASSRQIFFDPAAAFLFPA